MDPATYSELISEMSEFRAELTTIKEHLANIGLVDIPDDYTKPTLMNIIGTPPSTRPPVDSAFCRDGWYPLFISREAATQWLKDNITLKVGSARERSVTLEEYNNLTELISTFCVVTVGPNSESDISSGADWSGSMQTQEEYFTICRYVAGVYSSFDGKLQYTTSDGSVLQTMPAIFHGTRDMGVIADIASLNLAVSAITASLGPIETLPCDVAGALLMHNHISQPSASLFHLITQQTCMANVIQTCKPAVVCMFGLSSPISFVSSFIERTYELRGRTECQMAVSGMRDGSGDFILFTLKLSDLPRGTGVDTALYTLSGEAMMKICIEVDGENGFTVVTLNSNDGGTVRMHSPSRINYIQLLYDTITQTFVESRCFDCIIHPTKWSKNAVVEQLRCPLENVLTWVESSLRRIQISTRCDPNIAPFEFNLYAMCVVNTASTTWR
jgi:hypothetical protein